MQNKGAFADPKKSNEDDYFHKKEQELIKKMRRQAESEAEHRQMAETIGIADPEILDDLDELGYTHETVSLLYLVPLVQMAWIDGHVTQRERQQFFEMTRLSGVEKDGPAYRQVLDWLDHRPSEEFFQKTLRVIRDTLQVLAPEKRKAIKQDLLSCCTRIAEASGGILGVGSKISQAEQELLKQIAAELEKDDEPGAK
jgi:hypothetical protein